MAIENNLSTGSVFGKLVRFAIPFLLSNLVQSLYNVAVFRWNAFGAALATVMSQGLSMILCIIYLRRNNFQFDFKLKSFKIYPDQLRLILKIGLPTCLQNAVTSISFLFVTAIVNIVGGVAASAAVGAAGKFNSMLSSVLLRVPVCYIFAVTLNWGIRGVALGAPSAAAGTLVLSVIYLLTGRWKHSVIRASEAPAKTA
jgi:Na+-driven multidrug efflux pump